MRNNTDDKYFNKLNSSQQMLYLTYLKGVLGYVGDNQDKISSYIYLFVKEDKKMHGDRKNDIRYRNILINTNFLNNLNKIEEIANKLDDDNFKYETTLFDILDFLKHSTVYTPESIIEIINSLIPIKVDEKTKEIIIKAKEVYTNKLLFEKYSYNELEALLFRYVYGEEPMYIKKILSFKKEKEHLCSYYIDKYKDTLDNENRRISEFLNPDNEKSRNLI